METELKLGRQPDIRLAEEALKFRVPPDLMVTEERWVMVEAGVKGQQRQKPRVFRFWLAWTHLEFYPFQELGLARADQRPLCCVHRNGMSGHSPSSCPLITVGNSLPWAGAGLGSPA